MGISTIAYLLWLGRGWMVGMKGWVEHFISNSIWSSCPRFVWHSFRKTCCGYSLFCFIWSLLFDPLKIGRRFVDFLTGHAWRKKGKSCCHNSVHPNRIQPLHTHTYTDAHTSTRDHSNLHTPITVRDLVNDVLELSWGTACKPVGWTWKNPQAFYKWRSVEHDQTASNINGHE